MSDLVGNPEDRFSRDAAHIRVTYGRIRSQDGVCDRSHEMSLALEFLIMSMIDTNQAGNFGYRNYRFQL